MHKPRRKRVHRQPQRIAIPVFTTEDEEREFWASADSGDYADWGTAQRADLPSLKPSLTAGT